MRPDAAHVFDEDAFQFPYPTDPDDHCESSLQTYAHITPFLTTISDQLYNKTNHNTSSNLRIYDPYYCNGSVIENLGKLGFPFVYNKKEDCYQTWLSSSSSYPDYDVLITNPPYSGDHIEKLIQHVTSARVGNRPWFLLLPDWVHKKDYFVAAMKQKQIQPFYLVPKKRYLYLPPLNYRAAKKSDTHKKSSAFPTMWYIWGGTQPQNDRLIRQFYKRNVRVPTMISTDGKKGWEESCLLSDACDLARSKSALRDLRRKVKNNHNNKRK